MPPATAEATAPPDPATKAHDAVRRISTIATLPEVTSRIIATVENPNSSAAQLRKIVSHDPALVARILKVVNSSFYGLPSQVASIERAIVLVGLNAVNNIAVAASLGQMFRGAKLCEGFMLKDLWTHCIAVAVAAREMAQRTNPHIADEAFLAGMIHDLGMLVALQLWPEHVRKVCEEARSGQKTFRQLELDKFGSDHQHLGMALAEQWKFPTACRIVAGHHHDPQSSDDASRQLVTIVHAADVICCQSKHGFNLTALNETLDGVGIDPAIAADTAKKLDVLVASATALLK